eukprot:CAMPEP_0182859084 /NCGR_PEP_ID=MMETSP0034_2-20130328/4071_1 /TAXON_ID=156128 /ORGANISM="Nephroselmis pyriformis, Strain CCMP717" /LENGTH=57 /DNA_ID=CAMNT_0024990615 /DNA_START=120 /DNA_END=293 /DNA_ORIENTATION=-
MSTRSPGTSNSPASRSPGTSNSPASRSPGTSNRAHDHPGLPTEHTITRDFQQPSLEG